MCVHQSNRNEMLFVNVSCNHIQRYPDYLEKQSKSKYIRIDNNIKGRNIILHRTTYCIRRDVHIIIITIL